MIPYAHENVVPDFPPNVRASPAWSEGRGSESVCCKMSGNYRVTLVRSDTPVIDVSSLTTMSHSDASDTGDIWDMPKTPKNDFFRISWAFHFWNQISEILTGSQSKDRFSDELFCLSIGILEFESHFSLYVLCDGSALIYFLFMSSNFLMVQFERIFDQAECAVRSTFWIDPVSVEAYYIGHETMSCHPRREHIM